ncbi:MAG: response regulator transcription factor [Pyrinomonadaceae bacterium]|nr:response regulator transcription factor [Pyrinomonadaceae bacterium]
MKIRTLIVDDMLLARKRIKRFLAADTEIELVGECSDGQAATGAIRDLSPDLVFLDVQMPELDGFAVVETIGAAQMPAVIFVTAYDQYALRAFEVHALDYLLKPYNPERFASALARAKAHIRERRAGELDERLTSLIEHLKQEPKYLERLVIKTAGRVFFLRTDEISHIESAGNYVRVHTQGESYLMRETMNNLQAKLDPEKFLRIHRSSLVQIEHIKELQPLFSGDYAVLLHDGTELTLSRSYRDQLLHLFDKTS